MKKFYCFRAGQELPRWMWGVRCGKQESIFKSKAGKVTFGMSCIAIREKDNQTVLITTKVGTNDCYIYIKGFYDCNMGGINGATGVHLRPDDQLHLHGKGLKYKVTNSKVTQIDEAEV